MPLDNRMNSPPMRVRHTARASETAPDVMDALQRIPGCLQSAFESRVGSQKLQRRLGILALKMIRAD